MQSLKTRVCKECGRRKRITSFYEIKKGEYVNYRGECKACTISKQTGVRKARSKTVAGYKERLQVYKKNWAKRNKDKQAAIWKRYYDRNKEKIKERHGAENINRGRRYISEIHPTYSRKLLSVVIDNNKITKELIELKTKQLKLKRHVRQKGFK